MRTRHWAHQRAPFPAPTASDHLVASLFFTLEPYLGIAVAEERARNMATATLGIEEGSPREKALAIAQESLSRCIPTIATLVRAGQLDESGRLAAMDAAAEELAEYLRRAS